MSASERWTTVRPEWTDQQDPTTVAVFHTEKFEELKRQLAQEKRDIDGYMKAKDRQVIELRERLEEKERENEQLRTEITAVQKRLKEVKLELLESTETLTSTLNRLPGLSEENGQLKRKVTSLEDELVAARAQITQYEEDYKRVEANRSSSSSSSWFRSLMTSKESKKVGESKQSTADTQSAEDEEKQILTAQVNAYSRECDKLKKQLATANEETDSLRKELEQSYSHADAHVSKLVSDLDTERGKSQALNRKLDEMTQMGEKSTRANETLRLKLKTSEIKVKELEEQLNQRSVHSAPVHTGMAQQPQQANDSSAGQYVANNKRQIEETPQARSQVLLDRERELPDLTRLQLLEEDSERKRREADRALQEIEKTRREQQNQRVNFSDTYPQPLHQEHTVATRKTVSDNISVESSIPELPYDPNLVCPKCGKRYRIGGVQKFRRHVKERCTGKI